MSLYTPINAKGPRHSNVESLSDIQFVSPVKTYNPYSNSSEDNMQGLYYLAIFMFFVGLTLGFALIDAGVL